ncbi:MAG: hypothetical protein IKA74_00180 [Clostridia bacterium]|nr:hypothetical protein [Clostridia bacterium]
MEYVIIKLYVNQLQDDFHDINIDIASSTVKKLKRYAKSKNRKLFFVPIVNDTVYGFPCDCTPFAEIEYTGSLSEEEKKTYVEYAKRFSANTAFDSKFFNRFVTISMIRFKKIEDEIFEIS